MSDTMSVGVVGPSYWSYMASVMAEALERIVREKKISSGLASIPAGVYGDAQEFFNLVLQAVGPNFPDNPPASTNAYMIAADSIGKASAAMSQTGLELEDRLKGYSTFVEDLRQPRSLTESDLAMARDLQRFFLRLAQAGEAEAYERSVCSVTLPVGLRSF